MTDSPEEKQSTPPATLRPAVAPKKDGDAPAGEAAAGTPPPVQILESGRELSAATIGRMMGLATVSDLKVLDGKIDSVAMRMNTVLTKVERLLSALSSLPQTGDIDRLQIQIGGIKNLIRESMGGSGSAGADESTASAKADTQRRSRPRIFTSSGEGGPPKGEEPQ